MGSPSCLDFSSKGTKGDIPDIGLLSEHLSTTDGMAKFVSLLLGAGQGRPPASEQKRAR
jgi:hypothetical protein